MNEMKSKITSFYFLPLDFQGLETKLLMYKDGFENKNNNLQLVKQTNTGDNLEQGTIFPNGATTGGNKAWTVIIVQYRGVQFSIQSWRNHITIH